MGIPLFMHALICTVEITIEQIFAEFNISTDCISVFESSDTYHTFVAVASIQ